MKIELTQKLWEKANDWQTRNAMYMPSYDGKVSIAAGWIKKNQSPAPENFVKADTCSCMDTEEWSRVFFFRTTNADTNLWCINVVNENYYFDTDDMMVFPYKKDEDVVEEDPSEEGAIEELNTLATEFYQGVCYSWVIDKINKATTVNELGFIYRGISNWECNEGRDDMIALIISKAFSLGVKQGISLKDTNGAKASADCSCCSSCY